MPDTPEILPSPLRQGKIPALSLLNGQRDYLKLLKLAIHFFGAFLRRHFLCCKRFYWGTK
jgi:hypothetical protein